MTRNVTVEAHVVMDFPKETEIITSPHYTLRYSASDETQSVEVSIDGGGVPKAVEIVVAFGWSPDSIRFVSPVSSHATAKALNELFSTTTGTPASIFS